MQIAFARGLISHPRRDTPPRFEALPCHAKSTGRFDFQIEIGNCGNKIAHFHDLHQSAFDLVRGDLARPAAQAVRFRACAPPLATLDRAMSRHSRLHRFRRVHPCASLCTAVNALGIVSHAARTSSAPYTYLLRRCTARDSCDHGLCPRERPSLLVHQSSARLHDMTPAIPPRTSTCAHRQRSPSMSNQLKRWRQSSSVPPTTRDLRPNFQKRRGPGNPCENCADLRGLAAGYEEACASGDSTTPPR